MQKSIQYILGILTGLAIASLTIVLVVILWNWLNSIPLISNTPSTSPSADVAELANRVQYLENEQKHQLKVLEWKQDQKLLVLGWTALFISGMAAFLGIKTYNDLDKVIREKVNSTLEKELYQLDPTMLSIHLMKNRGQEAIWKRLELTGLKNLKWYDGFETGKVKQLFQGITIVPIQNADEQKTFCKFLFTYGSQLKPNRCAFILAAPPNMLDPRVLSLYLNLVPANTPATVASAVLVVGRGLRADDIDEKPKPGLAKIVTKALFGEKKSSELITFDLETIRWGNPEKSKEENK